MYRINLMRLLFAILSAFLLLPWCFAVPPMTVILVPVWIKFVKRLYRYRRRDWVLR